MKKKLLIALLLTTMSLTTAACTEISDNDSKTIQDIEPKNDPTDKPSDDSSNQSSGVESNLPEYAKVGQIVSGDKWSIALLYAKEYDSIDSGYYSDKPSDGNKFLVLFFDVKNISDKNANFNSMYFEGYADDYSVSSSLIMGNPDGMSGVGGNIDAGKMSKGVMVYEVPTGWKKFEISYKNGLWTSHKAATFMVEKDDISPKDYTYENSVFEEYVMDNSKKTEIGTEQSSDKWKVRLVDTKKYDTIEGVISQKPDEGKEFVIFYLEAENASSQDDYFNKLFFRFYVDGYLTNQTVLLSDIDGYSSMGGNVASGKKIKGYVAVQAPIGWKSVELIYDDGTFTENKVAEFGMVNE